MFWEMFIVDALLGNFDRHGMNWGFIKRDNAYALAPVFDNGSCLFPNMTDEDEMASIVTSPEETAKRVYGFPLSQIKLRGRKSSYYEVINSSLSPSATAPSRRSWAVFSWNVSRRLWAKCQSASVIVRSIVT